MDLPYVVSKDLILLPQGYLYGDCVVDHDLVVIMNIIHDLGYLFEEQDGDGCYVIVLKNDYI